MPSSWTLISVALLAISGRITHSCFPNPLPPLQKKGPIRFVLALYDHGWRVMNVAKPGLPQPVAYFASRAGRLSALELHALVAHEVGHDFLWTEFEQAQRSGDKRARRQLELQCDGIGALTLLAMGQEPMRLPAALEKLQRFNEERGGVLNLEVYPTLRQRERLVAALVGRR